MPQNSTTLPRAWDTDPLELDEDRIALVTCGSDKAGSRYDVMIALIKQLVRLEPHCQ